MESLLWFAANSGALDLALQLWRPALTLFVLYQSSYVAAGSRILLAMLGLVDDDPDARGRLPDALVVIPTLLQKPDDLEKLGQAVRSVLGNRYPGRLLLCVAVDDAPFAPTLVRALEADVGTLDLPFGARVEVVRAPRRVGKSMAMELALDHTRGLAAKRAIPRIPDVFFNLDADSTLSPRALERLARLLVTPRGLFQERPMIVAANVAVRRSHAWRGLRHFCTLPGQLALQVAREYATSIGLGRHTTRILPVTGVSGALYGTWTRLHLLAPAYGRYLANLRGRHFFAWLVGTPPPPFEPDELVPLPESTVGPGDDTWIAWIAMSARWRRGAIDLSLPDSPFAALCGLLRSYISRAIAYDERAVVSTSTPTTVRGLFKQRVRWNSSRLWLAQRRGLSMFFVWPLAVPVLFDLAVTFALNAIFVIGLLLWPFSQQPAGWFVLFVVGSAFYLGQRVATTLLALLQTRTLRSDWHLLLACPLSGVYHLAFNVLPTLVGFARDLLLFGVNTGFAPEETLRRNGVGRVALAFRVKRALGLAWRNLRKADVPVGTFWFGWGETPWTEDGYTGWTSPKRQQKAVSGAHHRRPPT